LGLSDPHESVSVLGESANSLGNGVADGLLFAVFDRFARGGTILEFAECRFWAVAFPFHPLAVRPEPVKR